ncbi:RnfH family protein [Sulfurivermis fontis]|jgi:putative ubiquitin-RnfH superfamily antitoxin RatB of RatAB toxin-antitoxin module|uniref:RnfH family protein n=1 Tax=Sulfurivermis fontis TaxID=1972068 RepID=UPI000FDBD231|nr:RnfH family protein [Sulfurivermis fontis]
MEKSEHFQVEVAYARPDVQVVLPVEVEEGTTLRQAIERSGVLNRFPEIDLTVNKVGVFGRLAKLEEPLRARDRVEIYRPLIADPKEVRKQRAAEGKRMKKGGGDVEEAG